MTAIRLIPALLLGFTFALAACGWAAEPNGDSPERPPADVAPAPSEPADSPAPVTPPPQPEKPPRPKPPGDGRGGPDGRRYAQPWMNQGNPPFRYGDPQDGPPRGSVPYGPFDGRPPLFFRPGRPPKN